MDKEIRSLFIECEIHNLDDSEYGIHGISGKLYSLPGVDGISPSIQILAFDDEEQHRIQVVNNIKVRNYLDKYNAACLAQIILMKRKRRIKGSGSLFFQSIVSYLEADTSSFGKYADFIVAYRETTRSIYRITADWAYEYGKPVCRDEYPMAGMTEKTDYSISDWMIPIFHKLQNEWIPKC